ncbi:LOW QUALITY PROTEIN: eukaryotic translation initiation factor 2D [Thrips palmi]|uniref:LOW QUALITY PROTEIN: eukaryotic translation initiation factor 2D n=1 Tax=Thrips palmi TaxID=161013 RepID=A0A6P9A3F2_THRPL|nr:LOW QUALITY PROTEIN: eukaryotic translation initiation factor 2D [Thrips palmi]
MFAKPFQVKSNSQLKGSARKKFRADVLKAFPAITEDAFNECIPNKDPVSVMKVYTHTKQAVHVYSIEKGPIAFEMENKLFPALYLLWQFPDLVPTFTTWPPVLDKIKNGADLMLPGVVLPGGVIGINSYGTLEKGDCVSVNLSTNRAPIAVGVAAHSSQDMYMCGGRGKCVNVLHFVGDLLWSQGKYNVPELGPPNMPNMPDELGGSEEEDESSEDDSDQKSSSSSSDDDDDNDKEEAGGVKELEQKFSDMETADVSSSPAPVETEAEAMDKLIRFCCIKALKTSAAKVPLPILASNFYKVHMLPACPSGKSVDLKKSSYKKLGKFLDEIAEEKILVQKELSKGVMSITSINYKHEAILTFLDLDAVVVGNAMQGHSLVGKCICGEVHTEQMYSVTPAVLPIFGLYSNRLGDQLTASSVKKVVMDYVTSKSLSSPDTSDIKCDEVLAQAVLGIPPTEALVLQCSDLLKRIMARMLDTSTLPPPKVAKEDKGKLTPIDIQTATRTGNKKVTLVANLEIYGVDVAEFAKECQRGVAASTTINPLPGRKGVQLQIQGNQVRFISQLLHDKYRVPIANMRGLDKAPKVKGQKKAPAKPKPKPK